MASRKYLLDHGYKIPDLSRCKQRHRRKKIHQAHVVFKRFTRLEQKFIKYDKMARYYTRRIDSLVRNAPRDENKNIDWHSIKDQWAYYETICFKQQEYVSKMESMVDCGFDKYTVLALYGYRISRRDEK